MHWCDYNAHNIGLVMYNSGNFILFNLKNGVINRENIRQFGSLIQKQLASGGAYYLIVSLTP